MPPGTTLWLHPAAAQHPFPLTPTDPNRVAASAPRPLGTAAGMNSAYRHVQEMLARFLREGEYYTNYVAVSLTKSTEALSI